MWYLAGSILVLGLFAAAMNLREKRRPGPAHEAAGGEPVDCCGRHAVCDRRPATDGDSIDYFDDEELDAYRGTPSDAYSEQAEDAFREVLYTLRESEVTAWLRSLQRRSVHLPDALKEEAFLIVGEQPIRPH
ncbi:MAG: phospholipase [Tannerella sp.]|jgi:hypothetical protein|nr:phospholipase [Tannerella sp.]